MTSESTRGLIGPGQQSESTSPQHPQTESTPRRSGRADDAARPARRTAAGYARPIVVGLLLLAAFAGLSAFSGSSVTRGPLHQRGYAVAIGFEVVLAAVEVALFIVGRRRPNAPYPAVPLRRLLARVTALLMVAVVVIMAANLAAGRGKNRILLPTTRSKPTPTPTKSGGAHPAFATSSGPDLRYLLYGLLGLVLLGAIVASAVYLTRRLPTAPAGYEDDPLEDEDTALRRVVQSGRAALATTDDARRAIIACYLAMEASLARAGATRASTETPDELLARAASNGLLHGAASARLTELFYEARFSSHPLPPAAIAEARQALDAISAGLDRPNAAEATQ
ncbi:MAG TPA: DUF4129 domain-containing protein [Streptosporangiaceae bacterium]